MTLPIGISRTWRYAAAGLTIAIAAIAACGRGPVFPPTVSGPPAGSVTFKFYVDLANGQISPGDGAYIIALNINQGLNNVYGSPEQPGYPTFAEAQGLTYGHWDQEIYYGTCPVNITNGFCNSSIPSNQFLYAFKAFTGGGSNTVKWLNIQQLPANSYQFFPNNSYSTGNGNAMQITIPITALNLRPSPTPIPGSSASPTPAPTPDNLYVQFLTVDTNGFPQDQMTCGLNSQDTIPNISLSVRKTYTFLACGNKPGGGPSDANLFIYGGEIDVIPLPGGGNPSPSPSPVPSPSPSA